MLPPKETQRLLMKHRLLNNDTQSKMLELLRLRVAQIHHRAAAVKRLSAQFVKQGELTERLQQLPRWASSSLFNDEERAALALCEKITFDPIHPLPGYLLREVLPYFNPIAIINLTLAIVAVNDWHFLSNPSTIMSVYFSGLSPEVSQIRKAAKTYIPDHNGER